jgi:hypothetical protein
MNLKGFMFEPQRGPCVHIYFKIAISDDQS